MGKGWAVLLALAAALGAMCCWLKKVQEKQHKPLVETFRHR